MKINYVIKYKDHFSEFYKNHYYSIIELNSKEFDKYWNSKVYYGQESFKNKEKCSRIESYNKLYKEITNNPEHTIAYPIISWVDENNIEICQGRHRIRAIIDSGSETIQIGIEKKYLAILKNQIDFKIIIENFQH